VPRAPHLDEVEERLARVLDRVVGVPEDRLADDRDLVEHGEPGVALEALCDQLSDADIAIPADMLAELEALAMMMGMKLRGRLRPANVTDPAGLPDLQD
jgi:hypothetical protein